MPTSGVGKQSTPDEVPKLDVVLRAADITVLETARENLSAVGEIFRANQEKGHSALQALCQRSFPSFPGSSTWRYTPHEVLVALFPEGTPVDDVQDALALLDGTLESRRMHRPYDQMPIDLQKDLTPQQGLLENEAMTSEPSVVDSRDWLNDPAWVKEVADWLENPPAYAHDPNPVEWKKTLADWRKAWGALKRSVEANEAKVYFSNDPVVRAKQYQRYVTRLHECWVAARAATQACGDNAPSASDPAAARKEGIILTYINDMVTTCIKGWDGQVAQLEEYCGVKPQNSTLHPLLQGLIAARDLRREWAQFTLNRGLEASGWDLGLGTDVHYEQALKNVGNDRFGLGYTPEDIQPEGVNQAVDSFLNAQVFWDRAERKCPELIDLLQSKYASFDQSQREKLFELLKEAYREDVGLHPALQTAPKEQSRRLAAMRPLIDQANRVADPEERREALRPLFKEMRELGVAAPMSALSCREAAEESLIGILKVKMLDRAWNQAQGLLKTKGMASKAPVDSLSKAITIKTTEHWAAGVELEAQAIRREIEKNLVDPVVRAEALDVLAEVETRLKSQESELLAERGLGSLDEALQDLQRSELESVVEQYETSHRTAVAAMVDQWTSYEARLQESALNSLLVDDERLTEFGAKVWATLCDAVTLRPEEQVGTSIARWIDTQSKEVMTKLLGLEWGPLDPRVAELLPGRPELEDYVTRLRQGGKSVARLLEPENLAKIQDEDLYRLVPQGSVTIKQLLDMTPEQVTCFKHPFVKELLRDRQCTVTQVLRMTPEQRAALQDEVFEDFVTWSNISIGDLMEMTRVEVTEVQRLLAELNGTYSQRELKLLLANLDWRDLDKLVHMTPEQADSLKHPFVWQLLKDNQCTATQVLSMTPQQLTALQDDLFEDFLRGNSITVPDLMWMNPEEIVEVKRLLPLAKSVFKKDTPKVVACVTWRNLDQLVQANGELVRWLKKDWVQDQLRDGKCTATQVFGMTPAQMAALTNKVFQPFLLGGAITLGDVLEMNPEQITGVEQALNQLVATHAAARLNQLIPAVGGWRHLDKLMHMTPAQAACLDLPLVQELLKVDTGTVNHLLAMTRQQRAALRDDVFEDFLRGRGIAMADLLEMQPEDIAEVKSLLPKLKRAHELRTLMWLVYCVGWQNLEKLQQMTPAEADCFKDPFVNELLKADKCTVDQVLGMTPEQRAALLNDVFKDFLRGGGITVRDLMGMNPVEIAAVEQTLIPLIATHTADTVNRLILAVGGWQNLDQLQRMTPEQVAVMLAPSP